VNQPQPEVHGLGAVDIRIPAKAEWVAVARLAASGIGSRLRFSIDEIEDLKLAIAEACTSVIQGSEAPTSIEIRYEATHDELRITVRGDGRGPKIERVGPPGEDPRVGELGVFLIRSLMDNVEYEVDPRSGPRLVMTKRVDR